MSDDTYFELDPVHTDPKRLRKEREKARKLRKSAWWKRKVQTGVCHYCEKRFPPGELTMDHVIPLARGGVSSRGNIVPSCESCNRKKKLETPVEQRLRDIKDRK